MPKLRVRFAAFKYPGTKIYIVDRKHSFHLYAIGHRMEANLPELQRKLGSVAVKPLLIWFDLILFFSVSFCIMSTQHQLLVPN